MEKDIKNLLEKHWGVDVSKAVVERVSELIDGVSENETEDCPVCSRRFMKSERALQYEDAHGDPACECQSPENIAAAIADMEVHDER